MQTISRLFVSANLDDSSIRIQSSLRFRITGNFVDYMHRYESLASTLLAPTSAPHLNRKSKKNLDVD